MERRDIWAQIVKIGNEMKRTLSQVMFSSLEGVCVCVWFCVSLYVYVCVYDCVCDCICDCVCVLLCVLLCVDVCVFLHVCYCMYKCVCVIMHVFYRINCLLPPSTLPPACLPIRVSCKMGHPVDIFLMLAVPVVSSWRASLSAVED